MATVTINDTEPRVQYELGSTPTTGPFAVPFAFFKDADIKVFKTVGATNTALVLNTDYTVTNKTAKDDGFQDGEVTLSVGLANATLTIYRELVIERTDDFPQQGPFNVQALNTTLDRLYAIAQEIQLRVARSVQLSLAANTVDVTIPGPDEGKALVWVGGELQNSADTVADIATLAQSAKDAAETAQTAAETAASTAESAATTAEQAATDAENAAATLNLPDDLTNLQGKALVVNAAQDGYTTADKAPASHVGAAGTETHPAASSSTAGFMAGSDKSKLDGIEAGATAYSDAQAASAAPVQSVNGQTGNVDLILNGDARQRSTSFDVTLTAADERVQIINIDAPEKTVTLPDATTIGELGGPIFVLVNTGTQHHMRVADNAGTVIGYLGIGQTLWVYLADNSTAAGAWSFGYDSERVHLQRGVVTSALSAVDFTSPAWADFDSIVFEFYGVAGSTIGTAFSLLFSDDAGSSYFRSGSYTYGLVQNGADISTNSADRLALLENSANRAQGVVTVYQHNNVSETTSVRVDTEDPPRLEYSKGGGKLNSTDAIDGVRFLFDAGYFNSGTFNVFGVRTA